MLLRFHHFQAFIILVILSLLASCSHTRGDGPPDYHVDVSNIANAVPRPEPLAKYGNYKSYVVLGKRYYTLKSSNNYNEIGTASWYGTKFHARKTSSGERYNMLGMTAAHKTLPLPTYVEVTNLRNNRQVIVKVNDRGPFESNRIIDLSYVAAKKLGMLGRGTATVRVRAINPRTFDNATFLADTAPVREQGFVNHHIESELKYPAFHPEYVKTGKFAKVKTYRDFIEPFSDAKQMFLQVGAFRNKSYAMKLQKQLKRLALPARIIHPCAGDKLYKVKIGPVRDLATLDRITHQLKELGIRPNKTYGA